MNITPVTSAAASAELLSALNTLLKGTKYEMKPTLTNLTERRKDAVAAYDAMVRRAQELHNRIQAQEIRIAGIDEQIGKASNADAHQPV